MNKRYVFIAAAALIITLGTWWAAFSTKGEKTQESEPQRVVGINVENTAPAFRLKTIDEKEISSDALRGKVVVLISSATWCSTCVYEAQQFSQVYNSVKGKDIVFLTIDIDPRSDTLAIHQFREGTQTPWDYANAKGGAEVITSYRLNRFEITYVVDKKGIIRYKDYTITSAETLTKILTSLL